MKTKVRKPTLLVVDDNPENLDIVKIILASKYQIKVALTGKLALTIVQSNPPDLILLDIMMPEMDGYEVCARLKENPNTAQIPVIFLTAKDHVSDETRGFKVGAVDYIQKPVSSPILKSRVKTHLLLYDQNTKLRKFNELLEEKVTHRTKDLQKANQQLQRLDKLKNDFLETVSHELRTPLAGIIGAAETLIDCKLDQEQTDSFMNIILEEGDRLEALIVTLLEISYLDTGSSEFSFSKSSFRKLFDRAKNSLKGQLANKVNLKIFCEGEDCFFECDEKRMEQVIVNILGNAIKFSDDKGEIQIRTILKKDNFTFSISDTGTGIPDDELVNIFNKFHKINRIGQEIQGVGLGLTIAKKIIEIHQGKIWAESSEKGAIFNVQLPFKLNF